MAKQKGRKRKADDFELEKAIENEKNTPTSKSKKTKSNGESSPQIEDFTNKKQQSPRTTSPLPDFITNAQSTQQLLQPGLIPGSSQTSMQDDPSPTQPKLVDRKKVGRPPKVEQDDTKLTDNVECCSIRYKCDEYHPNYNLNKCVDTVPYEK
jgi:hypothetical protein